MRLIGSVLGMAAMRLERRLDRATSGVIRVRYGTANERFAAPFYPDRLTETASALAEQLPTLRQIGRTVVFVTESDNNIIHFITR